MGDLREEQLRLQQLLSDSLYTSYVNRPVWNHIYDSYMDDAAGRDGWWNRKLTQMEEPVDESFKVGLFEPVLQSTFNSRLPFGENNAAAWYGRGITTDIQGGAYITSDYLTLTLRPQIVFQQNMDFENPRFLFTDREGNLQYLAEGIGTRVDNPYRFGPDPFWTSHPGQSSVRVHYKNLETGFSTEPLWWGGAVHYPLMMSNNAPGVPHLFIGSRGPIHIPWVGKFEFRWMGGWPEDSPYFDAPEQFSHQRFLNSANLSWSPHLFPGLYIGLSRTFLMHIPEGLSWGDVGKIFELGRTSSTPDDETFVDQSASIYFRWLFPKAHAEIYGEFFREDHSFDFRDFLMQPHHNSAFSFGFQKLFYTTLTPNIDFVKVNLEVTSLNPSRLDEIRWQTYFYTHSRIRQGQTNEGQILGAAIGPGSSSIYLGVDGYKGDFKGGLFIQRWVDNDHFHYRWNLDRADRPWGQGDKWHHRVNLNLGANFLWGPGPYYLQGKMTWTKAYNYGRTQYGNIEGLDWDNRIFDDAYNLQIQLGVRYVF